MAGFGIGPKALLPLHGGSIMGRLIEHLPSAQPSQILVYSRTSNVGEISAAVDIADFPIPITTVSNAAYRNGPIAALLSVLDIISQDLCILILGDVVFKSDPFRSLPSVVEPSTIYLGCCERLETRQIQYGHVVGISDSYRIVEDPLTEVWGGHQWSGMALFARKLLLGCQSPLRQYRVVAPRLGEIFNAVGESSRVEIFSVPEFINVNSPEDYAAACQMLNQDLS
jgi:NDP-sugar pyrophosphorylase family protein